MSIPDKEMWISALNKALNPIVQNTPRVSMSQISNFDVVSCESSSSLESFVVPQSNEPDIIILLSNYKNYITCYYYNV